jgi:hypothetical protein
MRPVMRIRAIVGYLHDHPTILPVARCGHRVLCDAAERFLRDTIEAERNAFRHF